MPTQDNLYDLEQVFRLLFSIVESRISQSGTMPPLPSRLTLSSETSVGMDQHLGVPIYAPVELVVRGLRIVDANLVRDDEARPGFAGNDEVAEVTVAGLDIAQAGAESDALHSGDGNVNSCKSKNQTLERSYLHEQHAEAETDNTLASRSISCTGVATTLDTTASARLGSCPTIKRRETKSWLHEPRNIKPRDTHPSTGPGHTDHVLDDHVGLFG